MKGRERKERERKEEREKERKREGERDGDRGTEGFEREKSYTFLSKKNLRFPFFFIFHQKDKGHHYSAFSAVLDEPEGRRRGAEALPAHVDAVLAHEPPVVAADAARAPSLGVVVVVRVPDVGVAHLVCLVWGSGGRGSLLTTGLFGETCLRGWRGSGDGRRDERGRFLSE